jgi:HAD superfamily hydrolase (TIGR01509 family)
VLKNHFSLSMLTSSLIEAQDDGLVNLRHNQGMEHFFEIPRLQDLQLGHDSLRGVLFDMDGTLFQTEPLHAQVFKKLALDMGLKVPLSPEQTNATLRGMSDRQVLETAKNWPGFPHDLSIDEFIDLKNQKLIALLDEIHVELWTSPLLEKLLQEIKNSTLSLGLVTSSEKVVTHAMLERARLSHYFDLIITFQDITRPKPAPDPYLKALQLLNLGPRETIVFEDSTPGLASARAAGCRTIQVGWWNE